MVLVVKSLPVSTGDIRDVGQEDPLEENIATHSNILALRTPWTEGPGGLESIGSQSQTRLKQLSMHAHKIYRE